eukprot:SAG11_NODE_29322_length_312_cov_0.723005_1_plen_51_part_10
MLQKAEQLERGQTHECANAAHVEGITTNIIADEKETQSIFRALVRSPAPVC